MKAWNASLERDVVRSIRRTCESPANSAALRQTVARQLSRLIPSEAYFFPTLDPDTGLMTHVLGDGAPVNLKRRFLTELYPTGGAEHIIDLARANGITLAPQCADFVATLESVGFRHEMRAAFSVDGEPWGFWCAIRERGRPEFTVREIGLLRRVAPWVSRGLRTAVLLATAGQLAESASAPEDSDTAMPGVVVVDARNRVLHRTSAAAEQLNDLSAEPLSADQVPWSILGLIARQRRAAVDAVELRMPGRSGRWYTVRVTLTEPDVQGRAHSVVVIAPLSRGEIAPLLARLWGLSPREREVAALVARGYPTKLIAARLGVSPYTVQEHLDRASEKVGVRGRRELLAKLFFTGYAKQLIPA
jgi:DNA-binding CsgD family transcriptional regulator